MNDALVIVLTGCFVAASCALVGSFLVLRRMALLGDAISHAVLPGIAIAFLATGSRASLPMLIGAATLGILTVALVETLHRSERLHEDASIGVVFPALFSLGVVIISRYASQTDLDLECVLYGEIAFVPLDIVTWGGLVWGPRALLVTGGVFAVVLAFVVLFYKELQLSTFDAGLAATLGFSPVVLHYALMGAVSITVVGSFEAVGAILVVAMLVAPPATAYLLTERLPRMLALAVATGMLAAVIGYLAARALDTSIAGAMAAACGVLFALALVFSPAHGVLARVLRSRRVAAHLADNLLLAHLGLGDPPVAPAALALRFTWNEARVREAAERLVADGLVAQGPSGLTLTDRGAAVVDASRLPQDRAGREITTP